MPVVAGPNGAELEVDRIVGSIRERELLDRVFREGAGALTLSVADVMEPPLR